MNLLKINIEKFIIKRIKNKKNNVASGCAYMHKSHQKHEMDMSKIETSLYAIHKEEKFNCGLE